MFTEMQEKKIIENWGHDVYNRLLREVPRVSEKWAISHLRFLENYSMNAIFFCHSALYGECVLKIGGNEQNAEFVSEYNVLREYNGKGFARVYESEIDIEAGKKVMLIERIQPGNELKDEKSLPKRLAVFSELYNTMHMKPANAAMYMKYVDKVNDYAQYMGKRNDCNELRSHMTRANELCASISAIYHDEMLLHGDLQYTNILRRDDGKYAIIDPQGLVGDPVFDIPRYILKEYDDSKDLSIEKQACRVNQIIEYFEYSLGVPSDILRKCFYVEIVTFECWCASVGEYRMDSVMFADAMMKNYTP